MSLSIAPNSFVIGQQTIFSLLSSMQPICNKRTPLESTECILFAITPRELTIKATDMEISLQATAEIESSVNETMSFLVSGKRIFDIVKEMDGDIAFTLQGNALNLRSGGVDLSLNIKSAQDFPAFPERIENLMHIDASFLVGLLNKVSFLVPSNNSNAALNGLLLEIDNKGTSMVATDGHSLARVTTSKYTLSEKHKWLLPKRAVMELKKIIEVGGTEQVFLGTCGSQLVFSGPNFNFFTKLIASPFPEYAPILDKQGFIPARVHRGDFSRTLKRTGCLLAGQFLSTTFTFAKEGLDVKLNNKEVGSLKESLPLSMFEGVTVESRFYSPYLLNGLQVLSGDTVNFHIKNSMRPIIFDDVHEEFSFTYLVMPVSAVNAS
ncbi:MAG: polymerase subunit beta [Candidatus Dependentiae bacterium]|nr:polymerase subunit beta [Candidatus Dependentiae bacterium]